MIKIAICIGPRSATDIYTEVIIRTGQSLYKIDFRSEESTYFNGMGVMGRFQHPFSYCDTPHSLS